MNIILEADKLNLETAGKLILCNPYHYNDSIYKLCTKAINDIVINQISCYVSIISKDSKIVTIKNEYYTKLKYLFYTR